MTTPSDVQLRREGGTARAGGPPVVPWNLRVGTQEAMMMGEDGGGEPALASPPANWAGDTGAEDLMRT